MVKKRRGLGRGLGALIQDTAQPDSVDELSDVDVKTGDSTDDAPATDAATPQELSTTVQGEPAEHDAGSRSHEDADEVEGAASDHASVDGTPPLDWTAGVVAEGGEPASESVHEKDDDAGGPAPTETAEGPENGDVDDEDAGALEDVAPSVVNAATEMEDPHLSTDEAGDRASRYLGTGGGNDASVSHETKRPVDVFFPDRRSERRTDREDSAAPVEPTESRAAPRDHNGRGRPVMPSMVTPRQRNIRTYSTSNDVAPVNLSGPVENGKSPAVPATGGSAPAELTHVDVEQIHPNPRQPRNAFDEEDMEELVVSIRQVGVLQPIVVRPVDGPTPYELVMGERRWRAAKSAGLPEIPAIIRHTSDENLLRDALLENLHRSQLNPLEEAAAYQQLLDDFNCTQDELSTRIGRSRPQISNTLRLMKLPPLVQRRVASGVLSAGHARALLSLLDPGEMERLAQKIVTEGLSVRATEELVSLQDGVRQAQPKKRPSATNRHERLDYWADSLTDELDTTVKITLGARKGKIAIDFASVDDLNRIMTMIQPSQRESDE